MKHGKIYAAILSFIGLVVSYLFGKRSSVRDNGSGAVSIRDGLDDSASKSASVTDGIVNAEKRVDSIAKRIDGASIGIDYSFGILQDVRARGAKKTDDVSH